MSKSGSVIAALLGGAVIGAVAALLLAPAKGSDTRAKLADEMRKRGVKLPGKGDDGDDGDGGAADEADADSGNE